MEHTFRVARALSDVFAFFADPTLLSAWLPEVGSVSVGKPADNSGDGDNEESFALTLRNRPGGGEPIAYEPPRQVAYRLAVAGETHVIRVDCTACDGATRVDIRETSREALTVDMTALQRELLRLDGSVR